MDTVVIESSAMTLSASRIVQRLVEQGVFDILAWWKKGNVGRSICVRDGLAINAQWSISSAVPFGMTYFLAKNGNNILSHKDVYTQGQCG